MTLDELLHALAERNLRLDHGNGRLRVLGDTACIDAPLREALLAHKPELIAMLGVRAPAPDEDEARPVYAPLTPNQAGILRSELATPGSTAYHMPLAVRLRGELRIAALRESIADLIRRHETLRTCYGMRDDQFAQWERQGDCAVLAIEVIGSADAQAIDQAIARVVAEPFNLQAGDVFHARLLRSAPDDHVLVCVVHHIAADGWSAQILKRDLASAYGARLAHGMPASPPVSRFIDVALRVERQRQHHETADAAFWARYFDGFTPVPIAYAPDPGVAVVHESLFDLTATLEAAVSTCAGGLGVSVYQLMLAALGCVLFRFNAQGDSIICRPQNNRVQVGDEAMVGLFLDALPLRVRTADVPDFAQLCRRVADDVVATSTHAGFSLAQILDAAPFPAQGTVHPLQQVALNFIDFAQEPLLLPGLAVSDIPVGPLDAKYALNVYIEREPAGLAIRYHARSDRFSRPAVACVHANFLAVLGAACADPFRSIATLALPPAEPLAGLPASAVPACIPELFRAVAARQPAATALLAADGPVSYAELQARVDALAAQLLALRAAPSAIVAILARRDQHLPAVMLACLQSGLVYTVVDAEEASGRGFRRVADLPLAAWICTEQSLCSQLPEASTIPCLVAGTTSNAPACAWPPLQHDQPACLTFTSGSSGRPRGVLGRHASLTSHLPHLAARFGIDAADRFAMLGGLMSDPLQRDVFTPLCIGACLVIPGDAVLAPGRLGPWLAAQEVTIVNLTPGMSRFAATDNPSGLSIPTLRWAFLCGDLLRWSDVTTLRALAPRCGVVNLYGMTESQRALSEYVCVEAGAPWTVRSEGVVPLGTSGAGTAVVVRNAGGERSGYAEAGEIFIESKDLALGYLGAAASSAARFLPAEDGRRAVRSGDRGRYLPDGSIEYLGRADQQVNIGAMRFAPAEIEACVARWPDVAQCRCAVGTNTAGETELTLFWTATFLAGSDTVLQSSELRRRLTQSLPAAMVPAQLVRLPEMPLNAAGKIDASRLVRPQAIAEPAGTLLPLDAAVAALWSDVLGVAVNDPNQTFFALGGSSLSALRLCERMSHVFSVPCPVLELFDDPSLRGCAARLRSRGVVTENAVSAAPALTALSPVDPDAAFGLTEVQQAYWIGRSASLTGGGLATAAYVELDIASEAADRVASAVATLIARHPMLRAVVEPDGRQRILPATPGYSVVECDLRGADAAVCDQHIDHWRQQMCSHTFDPECWPLFNVRLSRRSQGATVHIAVDMLIVDFWSGRILAQEFRSLLLGQALTAPSGFHFAHYVKFLRERRASPAHQAAQAYWHERADDLRLGPVLPAAAAAPRSPQYRRRTLALGHEAWTRLEERARALGVTKAAVLLTIYAQTLAHWAEEPRFSIVVTLYDRSELPPDAARTVGDFTSLLLLELELPAASFADRVRYVQRRLASDLQHRAYGAVSLLREMGRRRGGGAPVFVPFVFTDTLDHESASDDAVLHERFRHSQTSQVFIDHTTSRSQDGVQLHWNSVDGAFAPGLVETMFDAYSALVAQLLEPKQSWQKRFGIAPVETPAVPAWAPTQRIEAAFVRRALAQPQRLALVCGDERISYGDLLWRSARMARGLRDAALARGEPVAILLPKCSDQIVATIGVLLAGGTYVPVDPGLPAARIASMLEQAAVRIAVTSTSAPPLPDGVQHVRVADFADSVALPQTAFATDASDPAYVIFTSGSTGTPKGVVMVHSAVSNTLVAINDLFAVTQDDRVFGISALGFDLSVYDIFGTLAAGATLVLPTQDEVQRPGVWPALVRTHAVSVWNSVPALYQILIEGLCDASGEGTAALRLVMLSGDWIALPLAQRLVAQPGVLAVSLGGATEAAIWSIYHRIDQVDPRWRSIPYGLPLPNQTIEVLRDDGSPCPPLVLGEIHIGGAGLAREYCGDPARTAQSFVVYPGTSQRRYRTGDLGRIDAQGRVELVGRRDHQVKIAGHRIELGEIESTLRRFGGFESAVAVVRGEGGARHICAFVVDEATPHDTPPRPLQGEDIRALRDVLAEHLPAYMVPREVFVIGALPLSANGKIDRGRLVLLAPGTQVPQQGDGGAALSDANPFVREIAAMWKEVLPDTAMLTPRLGFFLGGGSSLSAMSVLNRINQHYGIALSIGEFYRHEHLADLSALVERRWLLRSVQNPSDAVDASEAMAMEHGEL
ncbi:non-ribosomal peptide synthetase [Tahibacter sp.]|uniref:non-ribosomal peptide synthetase n=1 Tax=Tahibacter sp. TaxID=2056211 RepID=UPI0028C4D97E|nr:non-ribosomal peptide synthetase [Tahibacter sp.]